MLTVLELFVSVSGSCRTRSPIGCSGNGDVEVWGVVGPSFVEKSLNCDGSELVLRFRVKIFYEIRLPSIVNKPSVLIFRPLQSAGEMEGHP